MIDWIIAWLLMALVIDCWLLAHGTWNLKHKEVK